MRVRQCKYIIEEVSNVKNKFIIEKLVDLTLTMYIENEWGLAGNNSIFIFREIIEILIEWQSEELTHNNNEYIVKIIKKRGLFWNFLAHAVKRLRFQWN